MILNVSWLLQDGLSEYVRNCWSARNFMHNHECFPLQYPCKPSRFTDNWMKNNVLCEWQFSGGSCHVHVRGQRRMARLVWDDRWATITQTTTCSYLLLQKTAGESYTRYHACKLRKGNQVTCAYQNWTTEDWKLPGLSTQHLPWVTWKHGSILPCMNDSGCCCWWCNGKEGCLLGTLETPGYQLNII